MQTENHQQPIDENRYQKNIAFWEQAWSRVKKASTKIPDVLDYIPQIPEVFKAHKCTNILDIACGSGWLSFYLNEHRFKVTGIDISESAIRLANELLIERKEQPEEKLFDSGTQPDLNTINFQVADMFAMNFPENHFDGILINACFEHLDYVRGKEFLQQIKPAIKPNGIMFGVFDKVASGERGTFEVLADGSHQYTDQYRDGMLLRNYPDEELNELLKQAQWEIESIAKNNYESRIVVARNIK